MTEDQFFATIKLVSGDEIICLAEPYDNGVITYKPLIIEDLSMLEEIMDDIQVKGLKLSKWIKSSTDDTFFIVYIVFWFLLVSHSGTFSFSMLKPL